MQVRDLELWIRIHWIQIQIRNRIQGFDDQKTEGKKNADPGFWWPKTKEKKYRFDQKLQFTYVQDTREAFSPQQGTSST